MRNYAFDPDQHLKQVSVDLPEGFVFDALSEEDLNDEYFEFLKQLSHRPLNSHETPAQHFSNIKTKKTQYPIVIRDSVNHDKIVANITVFTWYKFEGGPKLCAQIEDVLVHIEYRKAKLGKSIMEAAVQFSKRLGCEEVYLYCSEHNIPFYEKQGFEDSTTALYYYNPDLCQTSKVEK